jgi:hypothetical protein
MNAKTVAAALVSLTIVGVAACGDDYQSPVVPTPVVTLLTPVRTSITINGKTSSAGVDEWGKAWLGMVPGETARLTATATFSDNTERDVTAETVWTCDDGTTCGVGGVGVVGVVSPGVIRAQVSGWVTLVARYGSAQSSNGRAEALVRVAPEGAFLLGITVDDGHWAMMDALVQVTSSAGTFSARTPPWGIVTLPVGGDTVLQVEKVGYVTIRKSMAVSRDQGVNYTLQPSGTAPFTATGR